ncbi:MAG: hypothetical protein HGJ93_17680, partial [Desulfosarcina sp.]|nr:hypothetical protein [Desulfosarcina sp.]MBC2767712.1 hypothetical protein [Desulfosarcina sp.]
SFLLYYLGLFGNVPGPLAPGKIGNTLAGMGVTQVHAMAFFLLLFIIAASWNWVYNFVNLKFGNRMTCKRQIDDDGTLCGALVKRNKTAHSRTGRFMIQYECSHGHKRRDAHFHPIKKGAVSHTLWGISLCFCLMVFYLYGGLP